MRRLTDTQRVVLEALAAEPVDDGGWVPSAWLYRTAVRRMPKHNAYQSVFGLHKRGLVEATPGRSDRCWRITDAGRAALGVGGAGEGVQP